MSGPEAARVRGLLRRHRLGAKKALGQHFLIDDKVLERIAELATVERMPVIEIGPGLGGLTLRLATSGLPILGIERDADLIAVLEDELRAHDNVRILQGDALKLRLADVDLERPSIAGNLPYHISTPLLFWMLDQRVEMGPVTVMLQAEVAHRLCASRSTKAYGRLTVLFSLYAEINAALEVPAECFHPRPKVNSTVIQLRWRKAPAAEVHDAWFFAKVVKAAFSQRRKVLRNALRSAFPTDKIMAALESVGIDGSSRAENLSVSCFAALSNALLRIDDDVGA